MENKINIVVPCSASDIIYVPDFLENWSSADNIYILAINCASEEDFQDFSTLKTLYPQLQVIHITYTSFRFDLIKNDLFSCIENQKGLFLITSIDCWFIEENWKENILNFSQEYSKKIGEDKEWKIELKALHSLQESLHLESAKKDEFVDLFYGDLKNICAVGPGKGNAYWLLGGTADIYKNYPLHLFHARMKVARKNSSWKRSPDICEKYIRFISYLFEKGDYSFFACYPAWRSLTYAYLRYPDGFSNFPNFRDFLLTVLDKMIAENEDEAKEILSSSLCPAQDLRENNFY